MLSYSLCFDDNFLSKKKEKGKYVLHIDEVLILKKSFVAGEVDQGDLLIDKLIYTFAPFISICLSIFNIVKRFTCLWLRIIIN